MAKKYDRQKVEIRIGGEVVGDVVDFSYAFLAWRKACNAAKRRRRAIRDAGGQAGF